MSSLRILRLLLLFSTLPWAFGLIDTYNTSVWKRTFQTIDSSNTTSWHFEDLKPVKDSQAYNGSYHKCGNSVCIGDFTFQGTSVQFYGVKSGNSCYLEFDSHYYTVAPYWYYCPSNGTSSVDHNTLLLTMSPYDPERTTTIRFRTTGGSGLIGFDYAVVMSVDPSTIISGTISTRLNPPIVAILSVVLGGIITMLILEWLFTEIGRTK
ncbi:hypothetical protein DL96DRAFT_1580467 [Flagelloscypha sp. PMI_526]|nr:hypothetical protein DL96DRAFT_1580467 [Flagelloscypha sp. PMI_526]